MTEQFKRAAAEAGSAEPGGGRAANPPQNVPGVSGDSGVPATSEYTRVTDDSPAGAVTVGAEPGTDSGLTTVEDRSAPPSGPMAASRASAAGVMIVLLL